MPGPPDITERRVPGQITRPLAPERKHGYPLQADLNDDHPCAPYLVPLPVYTPIKTDPWPAHSKLPDHLEHHDSLPTREHIPQQQHQHAPNPASAKSQPTQAELTRLSSRPYSLRASDPSDFASAWETTVAPLLIDILQESCTCDYAVDVHNFPEMSSEAVPRVIYITFSDSGADGPPAGWNELEKTIRSALAHVLPERFAPVHVEFRRSGGLRRSNWWGEEKGQQDTTCAPKNVTYRPTPVMGMSIGPMRVKDAASLGGFVRIGSELYAMSAFHAFEDSLKACHLRVSHPAEMDLCQLLPENSRVRPYSIGTLTMWAPSGTLRKSLTFQGTNFPPEKTMVEMDWCLIGPVANGKNIVTVPSFQMNRSVAVENTAPVEGNTEVYAIARTSGYSLGFTSDVPGLLRISGKLRREWTVRQYSPLNHPKDGKINAPWQTLKEWVTSGIGVPGDSGAWLMRRSDNALMGLIWGRNHDSGSPLERVRLAYFTPMVDILADIRQNHAEGETVTLPTYSAKDLTRTVDVRDPTDVVQVDDMSQDPWNVYTSNATRQHRQVQADLILSIFVAERVPESGTVLDRHQRHEVDRNSLSLTVSLSNVSELFGVMGGSAMATDQRTARPRSYGNVSVCTLRSQDKLMLGSELESCPDLVLDLSASSSTRSVSSVVGETSQVVSVGNNVRIVGEEDIDLDIMDVEEPIRAKARPLSNHPGFSKTLQWLCVS